MPSNITASSAFTEPVQIPNNGEVASASDLLSTTIQPLVNRDQYLKDTADELAAYVNALRTLGVFQLSAAGVADGGNISIAGSSTPTGAFTVADDTITVAEEGTYVLGIANGLAQSSSTESNVRIGATIRMNSSNLITVIGTRFSSDVNHYVQLPMCGIYNLSAGVVLDLVALSRDESFSADGDVTLTARLSIHRIR